jgi:hypothetical protein
MRKTVIPKIKNNCLVLVKVEYFYRVPYQIKRMRFKSYKAIYRRVGNTFLDRRWGPFSIKTITLLPYGPQLPV